MADWTIRVAQSPIGFGTPYKHNIIVVADPEGRAVYEFNGGPVDADGNIIPFNDRRGPLAYLSGDFPAGAKKEAAGALFYRPDLDQRVVFSGTEEQVRRRIDSADACVAAINAAREKYTLLTGPSGGRDDPSKPTFNSNSVSATLLQCMGIPVSDPAITSQPGYQNPILDQDQVKQIIEQQNPAAPPAGRPPADNIPIPRPKPEKRGDDHNNSNAVTFADLIPSASPTMQQNGAPPRRGAELSDMAMEALEREARPGLTEHELAAIVEGAYVPHGGQTHIHYLATTPMRQPSVCVPAQQQSNRVLERGDVLITEISAHYNGYPGQIQRPFAIGEGPTLEYQRLYDVAAVAFQQIAGVVRAGVGVEEVLEAAERIHAAGYSICDDLVHGFGGGYLPPIVRTRETGGSRPPAFTFEEDMTIVIQPNVITPDERMGLQVGELVRVTATGVESLHRYPMRFVRCA